jgi:hypothetical protein
MLMSLEPYQVVLISMDTACGAARRARLNFPVQHRVVGVSGDDTPEDFQARFRFLPCISERRRRGFLGCFWSHRAALRLIVEHDLRHAVVVEDDVVLRRAMPAPEELGGRLVALEGLLTTPGVWARTGKEFASSRRMECWQSLRPGLNEVDTLSFTLLGTAALYVPDAGCAEEILRLIEQAPRLKAIDFFYRQHRVFQQLYFPNPFACEDLQVSEIHDKALPRDLYLGHAKDLKKAKALLDSCVLSSELFR